ncbi:MAG TPA: hypothetical protein VFS43_38145 [Polyangiaceae bacterium]|nr:hypothetical protein [Polyangiaceae bacterium]
MAGSATGGTAGAGGPVGAGGAGGAGGGAVVFGSGGDSCANALPISLGYGPGMSLVRGVGNTQGDASPTDEVVCLEQAGVSTPGPDRVHAVTVNAPEGGYLTARLVRGEGKTEFDSVLYAREACEGAAAFCADASLEQGGVRSPVGGGELLSVPVRASPAPTTLFLFVDGVGAGEAGRYDIELSLNRGTCEDPIPVFVEPGSPVRARVSTDVAANLMSHSCGTIGTVDVMFKVTRAGAGPMGVQIDSADELAIAFLDQTCNGEGGAQLERPGQCIRAPEAFLGETAWPDEQRSIFVAIDGGIADSDARSFDVIFDPAGGLDLRAPAGE